MLLRSAMILWLSAFALAGGLHAHPGHAVEVVDGNSLTHYAAHPDHLMVWLVAIVSVYAIWHVQRRGARKPELAHALAPKNRHSSE